MISSFCNTDINVLVFAGIEKLGYISRLGNPPLQNRKSLCSYHIVLALTKNIAYGIRSQLHDFFTFMRRNNINTTTFAITDSKKSTSIINFGERPLDNQCYKGKGSDSIWRILSRLSFQNPTIFIFASCGAIWVFIFKEPSLLNLTL